MVSQITSQTTFLSFYIQFDVFSVNCLMLLTFAYYKTNCTNAGFTFSGPAFWGLINPEWSLCNKGRRQSPVNLEPSKLLFDPNLRPLHIDKHRVRGLRHPVRTCAYRLLLKLTAADYVKLSTYLDYIDSAQVVFVD